MPMVDARDVVEVGMLQKWMPVDGVHGDVEGEKGSQADERELNSLGGEEGHHHNVLVVVLAGGFTVLQQRHILLIHPPHNRRRIDKGINLEMHTKAQQQRRKRDAA